MMDIALGVLGVDGVQLLSGGQGVQGADGQHLGLAAGEQAGAVYPGQHANLSIQRTNFVHAAAVHTLALEQPLLNDLLLHLVEAHLNVGLEVLVLLPELLLEIKPCGGEPLFPDILVGGVQGVLNLI